MSYRPRADIAWWSPLWLRPRTRGTPWNSQVSDYGFLLGIRVVADLTRYAVKRGIDVCETATRGEPMWRIESD